MNQVIPSWPRRSRLLPDWLLLPAGLSVLLLPNPAYSSSADEAICKRLQNARFSIAGHQARLHEGTVSGGTKRVPLAPDEDAFNHWSMSLDQCAAGDLNGDGSKDAAVVMMYSGPSTGQCVELTTAHLVAMVNKGGHLVQTGDIALTQGGNWNFEDLAIKGGVIILHVRVNVDDPKAHEVRNEKVQLAFKLVNGKLVCTAPGPKRAAQLDYQLSSLPLSANPNDVISPKGDHDYEPDFQFTESRSMRVSNVKSLTRQILDNACYSAMMADDNRAPMKEGQFPAKPAKSSHVEATVGGAIFSNGYDFTVRIGDACFGDLNGDGANDAAVLLESPMGADGFGLELAPVLNDHGRLVQVGDVFLGRAIRFLGMKIEHGIISVKVMVHGPDDSVMSPTQKVTWRFRIVNGHLIKLKPGA